MTPKQRLVDHIRDHHAGHAAAIAGAIEAGRISYKELGEKHAGWHHRYRCSHAHAGENLGSGHRPPGWRTGEDVIPNGGAGRAAGSVRG